MCGVHDTMVQLQCLPLPHTRRPACGLQSTSLGLMVVGDAGAATRCSARRFDAPRALLVGDVLSPHR
jgi:hypothetical protein